jgi:hypothetical protein
MVVANVLNTTVTTNRGIQVHCASAGDHEDVLYTAIGKKPD